MTLQLLPVEERDLPVFARIVATAFQDGIMQVFYPEGYKEANHERYTKELTRTFLKGNASRFNKIVDSSLPDDDPYEKIISVAKWEFYASERSEAELDAEEKEDENSDLGPNPGANTEAMDAFHGGILRSRRQVWGGRPYVLLHLLATLPQHHRRGAGSRHLQWGIAAAEGLNLPLWLEASAPGKPLYERFGFKAVDHVEFDAKCWGLGDDFILLNMLRAAQPKS